MNELRIRMNAHPEKHGLWHSQVMEATSETVR